MKVIMLESTNNVGMVGEIVNVKPGFARNYLLPLKKAVVADDRNLKSLAHQKKVTDHKVKKAREKATALHDQIHQKEIIITKKSATGKKLFGSVTSLDVQQTVQSQLGFTLNRKSIVLDEAIKVAGTYTIPLKLDGGLESALTLIVRAEEPKEEKEKVAQEAEAAAPKKKKKRGEKNKEAETTEETQSKE